MKIKLAALAVAIAFACSPVWAGAINFNFGSCTGVTPSCTENASLGTNTAVYTVGTSSVTAIASPSSLDLYVKNITGNPSEMGLGIAQVPNNELEFGQTIFLNLGNVANSAFTGTLMIGSAQNEEGATVCEATGNFMTVPGTCQTMFGSTANTSDILTFPVTWNSTDSFLSITSTNETSAPHGDVLVDGISVNTTPEPSSLILFGTMLLGIGLVYSRLRRVKASS